MTASIAVVTEGLGTMASMVVVNGQSRLQDGTRVAYARRSANAAASEPGG